MRRIILMLLLAVVSSNAMASDWVSIDSAGDKERHVFEYADNGSIHTNGDIVTMWALEDYKFARRVQGQAYRSIKMQWEVDCKSEQMRVVDSTYFYV
ncbi:MAG: surface-adhesin E family protein [Gallionella sp.]